MDKLIEIFIEHCRNRSDWEDKESGIMTITKNFLIKVGIAFYIVTIIAVILSIYLDNEIINFIWIASFSIGSFMFFGYIIWEWWRKKEDKSLQNIKDKLNESAEEIKNAGFTINNFRINSENENKYIIRDNASQKNLLAYNIELKEFYIIKDTLKAFLGKTYQKEVENIKAIFKDYETDEYPSFSEKYNEISEAIDFIINLQVKSR